ncbi:MAG: MFS transporter [Armatimonadetes bacterium]|nr:MFS transporter [Armatimonadota bacterium]
MSDRGKGGVQGIEPGTLTPIEQRRGMSRLFCFAVFNSLSFEIIGGQILILFARQVGASLMQIGLLVSFAPFASIIQLAVAPLVTRFGPKAVMFTGWTARTVAAAFLLGVPWVAGRHGPAGATLMLLGIMALFYLFRALGMSSWLPLLQEIVPPGLRGDFLGKQEILRHLSIIAASLLTAVYLLGVGDLGPFLHVIAVGVLCAAVGLAFLSGIPHVEPSGAAIDREFFRQAIRPLRDATFRHYLLFAWTLRFAMMSLPAFVVLFLRDAMHLGPSAVLFITTLSSAGAAASLIGWGPAIDRFGSKPVLLIGLAGMVAVALLWATIEPTAWMLRGVAPAAAFLHGVCNAGVFVALMGLELELIPREGREHYVAASVTLAGIAGGLSPLMVGALLHALEQTTWHLGPVALGAYRVYFLATALLLLPPLALRPSLKEKPRPNLRRALRVGLERGRRRAWARLRAPR